MSDFDFDWLGMCDGVSFCACVCACVLLNLFVGRVGKVFVIT